MAIDAVRLASSLDAVVLVTGDGDFIPLVDYLRWGLGREVEVAGFSRTSSGKLREVGDRFIPIEEIPRVLLKSARAAATRRRAPGATPSEKEASSGAVEAGAEDEE